LKGAFFFHDPSSEGLNSFRARKQGSTNAGLPAKIQGIYQGAGDERPVLILAQDEGCFGRISQVKRAWAPPGVRPHVPVRVVREYVYVYAAVAPTQGQMVSLVLPETSTAMMNLELSHVSRSFPDHFIMMQVDQAGWHRSQELHIPANIRLIPQPAYSPEVNPIEHGCR
jgi:hypothetical protein